MYTKNDLLNNLKDTGLIGNETIMIHSSFSKVKNIDGGAQVFLNTLKEYFKNGLLLLPSHTWASIKNDYDTLYKDKANSCVGYLTNVAINDKDFIRSNHPTHSVLAYGINAREYILDDNFAKTPVPVYGSFGKLRNNGYILFIGAPLSKNTFIHSIEEEFNVPNRFTSHIYTFYTKSYDKLLEFKMPRHYSTLNPHISDNYEKILPLMLKLDIAKKVKILDSTSYLVDAKKLYELVKISN